MQAQGIDIRNEELENFKVEYEEKVLLSLREYIDSRGIEDMNRESQNRWNAALMHTAKAVFKDRTRLKAKPYDSNNLLNNGVSNNGAYDLDKINSLCDIYINICCEFDKEVSILGFSNMLGIDDSVIYNWANGNRNTTTTASTTGEYIRKKLLKMREESLSNMAISGKKNPVGPLAALNHHYNWNNTKTVIHEERIAIAPMSREQITAEFGDLLCKK